MDDTPRRVKNEAEDAAMRRPAEEFRGQSDEKATSAANSPDVRNYSASAAVGARTVTLLQPAAGIPVAGSRMW